MLAFNRDNIHDLEVLVLAKKLLKDGFIEANTDLEPLEAKSKLYHPGLFMRIFLFLVGLIGGAAAVGLWFYLWRDALEHSWRLLSFVAGAGLITFLEIVLIRTQKHYKSGITEAVLYGGLALLIISIADSLEAKEWLEALFAAFICAVAAIRYADSLLSALTLVLVALSFLLFVDELESTVARTILPFFTMLFFTGVYAWLLRLEKKEPKPWLKPIYAAQVISLLLKYAGGNYLVVRELNVSLSGGTVQPGEDIPMAWIFYALTILIPVFYLYMGVKRRDRIRVWAGMFTAGFSVFTFKYYYSFGHPEVTLTISGLLLLGLSVYLLTKLKKPKKGITRDRLAGANLDFLTAEGIFISQTLGGTTGAQQEQLFKGGHFGGGGASGDF